ncbi:cell division protein PerM [Streptomyces sp. NPDC054975]
MTHLTDHTPSFQADPLVQGGRSADLAVAFVRGGVAAGLGLGALAVLVTAAWISSPYPESGPGEALHTAAGLWLLAHGVDLIRTETLTGVPAPLGVAPLLLMAVPVWLVHRTTRDTLEPYTEEASDGVSLSGGTAAALGALTAVCGGYLLVAAGVVLYSASGPLPADLLTAGLWLPSTVAASAGLGAWTAAGRPLPRQEQAAVALRSVTPALVVLLAGGAAVFGTSLVWHAGAAQESFAGLAGEWSGRVSVLLLAAALVPNAAVWATSYALGPGFAIGTGASATPLGLTGTTAVPPFPLLAALPGEGPGGWAHWAAVTVPLVAAVVLGVGVGRPARAWTVREAALTALIGAWVCGAATALLAAAAGGPLGSGRLSVFGPVWWQTGAAAVLWCAAVGVPVSLGVRAWGLRGTKPAREPKPTPPSRGLWWTPGRSSARLAPAGLPDGGPVDAGKGNGKGDGEGKGEGEGAAGAGREDAYDEDGFESYDFLPAAWEPALPPPPPPLPPQSQPSAPPADGDS